MVWLRADRGRIDQDLGARQRVGPRKLGEPLVPAGRAPQRHPLIVHDRQFRHRERISVGRAGTEVTILVVAGRDRDVELAGAGHEPSVWRDDNRRVVAKPVAHRPRARTARRGCGHRSRAAQPGSKHHRAAVAQVLGSSPGRRRPVRCDREVWRQRQLLEAHDPRSLDRRRSGFPARAPSSCSAGSGCQRSWTRPSRSGGPSGGAGARGRGRRRIGGEQFRLVRHCGPGGWAQTSRVGTCWVMQCGPPPPNASTTPGTGTTSRPG